jgi:hypothetical protein
VRLRASRARSQQRSIATVAASTIRAESARASTMHGPSHSIASQPRSSAK